MELQCNHIYHNATWPLTDIQVTFSEGITCILGDDREGKRLLQQLLTARQHPQQGQISFLGYDIAALGQAYLNHLSYPSQYPLYPPTLSLRHYLIHTSLMQRLSARAACQKAEALLWELGMPDLGSLTLNELPDSLRRRVLLLQTLRSEAPILILDEPFRHIGPGERRHMEDILAQYLEEKIILIFTQKEDPFPDLPCCFYTLHKGRLTPKSEKAFPPAEAQNPTLLACGV